uniref:Suppressor of ferric uptake 1 n=1 Tax=Ganoderma boninense TaxID=34458 RepID=A0A5K1K5K5_9APHY|nr:Suppressor of ferric uptake 1 [Ganoderma boninense]
MANSQLRLSDVPDVLHHIFSYLDPVHPNHKEILESRRSLAMAARTCRGFSGPALDVLWKRLSENIVWRRSRTREIVIIGSMLMLLGDGVRGIDSPLIPTASTGLLKSLSNDILVILHGVPGAVPVRCCKDRRPGYHASNYPIFVKHFRAHPAFAAHVKELHFLFCQWFYRPFSFGWQSEVDSRPFDVEALAPILPFLTSLAKLLIIGCDNKTDAPSPFLCETLVVDSYLWPIFHHKCAAQIWEIRFSPASLTLRNLVVQWDSKDFYDFFERVLVPGRLRGLATRSVRKSDLPSLRQFLLSPAAQNLLSISIGCIHGVYDYAAAASAHWTSSVSEPLGAAIAQCTRVQYVRVGLVLCSCIDEVLHSQSGVLGPVLANLPASLRAFSLHIWLLVSSWPGCFDSMRGRWARMERRWDSLTRTLAAVDRSLHPAGEGRRFPHLRRVELHVHFLGITASESDAAMKRNRQDIEHAAMPLPRLKAASLLREFRVDNEVHDSDVRCELTKFDSPVLQLEASSELIAADVYWPPDSEMQLK